MDSEQASLGVGMPTGLPGEDAYSYPQAVSEVELSTGSLDGAKNVEKPSVSGIGTGSDAPDSPIAADATAAAPTPKIARYFIQPTSGYDWGILHNHNAVDIANSCGTPVIAAAAGTVVEDPGLGDGETGWNGGYGEFVLIQHPNGTKTRYAHLSRIEVGIGERVEQGEEIGRIGNTGQVRGETGCHLHFEVIGGTNPFVKR